jgi:hypothetical protein
MVFPLLREKSDQLDQGDATGHTGQKINNEQEVFNPGCIVEFGTEVFSHFVSFSI